jgi:hypothetical protein
MSTANVGVVTGKTLSLVAKMKEYPDTVIMTATDTVTATLQQKAVNQPIIAFTMATDVADAKMRWILVYATGTVISDGTALNDVDTVKVWYDADNNGFLGAADVMIGSGTFGNTTSGPLVAKLNFGTEQTILTASKAKANGASQRYFITYDIKASALPNDSAGNQRYLGAYLKAESLPQGSSSVDDVTKNAISLPNTFSAVASSFPFISAVREIVAAPSTVTVLAEPVFSPATSGSMPSLRLAQAITTTGSMDASWLVVSTDGFPTSGYGIVDNEIISYTGTAPGALLNVSRGVFESPVVTHVSGAVLGGMVYQGWNNYPFLKLTLTTPGYGVRWAGLKLSRKQPASLTGYDSDAAIVKIWKDNGNGVFDRDSATGLNTADTLIGSGTFGDIIAGKTTISVADPSLVNQNYVLLSSTPTVIFVTMDINKTSNFSNAELTPQNDVMGVYVPDVSNFIFGPANSGHVAQFANTVEGQTNVVMPMTNVLTLIPEDISPVTVTQNDRNVGLLSMKMYVDKTSAKITKIKMDRTGSANDSDIDLIKVWKDSNDNCLLDSVDLSSTSTGAYVSLLSYGNESYSSGTVTISLKSPLVVTTVPVCAFISYDVSEFSIVGSTMGLSISSAGYFTVGVPNSLSLSTWPVVTTPMTVKEVASNVRFGANDIAADLVIGGGVVQSQAKVPMLRFNLATEAGNSKWTALKVQRTGSSNDTNAPYGKNTDVKFITVYQDSNQNDVLDVNDLNVSEAKSSLAVPFPSTATLPFNLILQSTTGYPSSGRLYIGGSELATYSGSGIDAGSGKPYLIVTSRGEKLGDFPTTVITHYAGEPARKVDLFDQENLLNTQTLITLAQVQTLSPVSQTYFVAYDVGDTAVKSNKLGVSVRDKSWVTVNSPHDVSSSIYTGITKSLPTGTGTDIFPFASSLVPVQAVTLTAGSANIAPKSAEKGTKNVPMMTLTLATQSDYVALGQINLTQLGTINTGSIAGFGDGDLSAVKLWKDDGDGAFSPVNDTLVGTLVHTSTVPFNTGVPVNISYNSLPYIIVSTQPVILHVSCDISTTTDLSGANIMGHSAGLSLAAFTDLRGIDGVPLSAAQSVSDTYPMASNEVKISSAIIQLTPVYKPIMLASNGYPAYAVLDSSGNVTYGSDNLPVPDTSKWIYNYTASGCKATEPLIDVNGDGIPDNFDYYGTGKCVNVSLNNSGKPSYDINSDGLLDFEVNGDYVPDYVQNDGSGKPLYFIGDIVQNVKKKLAVSDMGAIPSAWASKTTELPAMWDPASNPVVSYEMSVGGSYSDPSGVKNSWQSAGKTLSGKVTNLSMSPGHFTTLTSRIALDSSSFTVTSAADFAAEGLVYVGNELMLVTKLDSTSFAINARAQQGSFKGIHTAWGETVSDRAYVLSVRGVMADGSYVPSETGVPLLIYRIDTTYPSVPGAPQPQVAKGVASGQSYTLKWDAATDNESNIMAYEIQERVDTNPVWTTIATVPGYKTGGAINNIFTVGDPVNPGESPRPLGHYYTYRVRSWNFAGLASGWSDVSTPAGTTIGTELLSKVSNYPNPVDTRKGGVEGKTVINYTLNDNAEVTITVYDLLGYVVREFHFSAGSDGGKLGPNFVLWDGKNGLGGFVAKGGYIVRVKASSAKGSKVIMRKVGVIH